MTKVFRRILLLVVVPLWVQGQEASEPEPQQKGGRLAWIACTSLPDDLENPAKVLAGKETVEVTLSMQMPSGPIKIPADGIVRLVREVPDAADPGKKTILTLAKATVAENVREALIILMPLPKPEGDLRFAAKVQNLADFKGGDWLFLNLTTAEIGVQLGTDRVAVQAGGSAIHSVKNLSGPKSLPLSLHFRIPPATAWEMITASTVPVMPTRREICIFSKHSEFGTISYTGITFPVAQ